MIWKPCQLQAQKGKTEDELGNLVGGSWETVLETFCRATPWAAEDVSLEGRDVTRNEQRFIIPVRREDFPDCTHAVIDGIQQEITQKIDLGPRWTVIQVKVYREPYYGRI